MQIRPVLLPCVLAALAYWPAHMPRAQEATHIADAEEAHHRYVVAGFVGYTRAHGENEFTLGVEGGIHFTEQWSAGVVLERAERQRDTTLILAGVGWHPLGRDFRLQVGAGAKDPSGATELVLRTGLAYEMDFGAGWFIRPYLAADFIANEDNETVFGLYIGRGF